MWASVVAAVIATAATLTINFPIRDRDELWLWCKSELGVAIPRVRVCEHHVAPFTAFADAYFGETESGERVNVAVWKASRGLGGKSHLEATLGRTEAETLGASASILGGSKTQSDRVLEYITKFFELGQARKKGLIDREVTSETHLANGAVLTSLTASTKSARGAHPQRLRMDEIDEMAPKVLRAALGQPMRQPGINGAMILPQTVLCSTHQYADGPMTWALAECDARDGWRAYEWCYRENLAVNGGWLTEQQVDETRETMTVEDWETEVEGQEPRPDVRAISDAALANLFDRSLGEYQLPRNEAVCIEEPQYGALYAKGCDWAKKRDEMWVWVLRIDCHPYRVVYVERRQKEPWPTLTERFDAVNERYPGPAAHDSWGVGAVVADYMRTSAEDLLLQGERRKSVLSGWGMAAEKGRVVGPWIDSAYTQHKRASADDVYRTGESFHCPDSIMAGAIALYAADDLPTPYSPSDDELAAVDLNPTDWRSEVSR